MCKISLRGLAWTVAMACGLTGWHTDGWAQAPAEGERDSDAAVAGTGDESQPVDGDQPAAAAEAEEEIVREATFKPRAMLYFIEGQQYLPPFRLIQTDYRLTLEAAGGQRLVVKEFPVVDEHFTESLPEIPATVTAASSWEELDQREDFRIHDALNTAKLYYACRYRFEEVSERYIAYVRDLPFVASAEWVSGQNSRGEDVRYLRIVSKAGDERHQFTSWWDPARKGKTLFSPFVSGLSNQEFFIPHSPQRLARIKKVLDRAWDVRSKSFVSGAVSVSDGTRRFGKKLSDPPDVQLVAMTQILDADLPAKDRADQLGDLLKLERENPLLVAVHGTKEQLARLEYLAEQYDQSPELREWFHSFTPQPPTAPAQR